MLIDLNFLAIILISLFYYYETVFTLTNIWKIWRYSIKLHYLKRKIFTGTEDSNDADYIHAKRVSKDFDIKKLGECHNLLADVFENFRNMCLKIYELDKALFLIAPGLAWHAALEKTKVKLYLLTDISMLLMVEKGIRAGIYHAVYQ